ncbi:aryl hydrocarbon receptor nuclear translocator-like protein 2 isoform X1 [Rhopalosiphum maidis]|uniref:aryl hydrocarbon receptor nuclear translocator-like protein 2 isoform X1 n=1 Tax=Rhopalosiphum maidis TaxID=43146 RepID=UPI000EFF196B|nr:aryl hydrocarbon receptor nuclear translocator-like protein 2 isoform X1 [Rhopalosiphum maidis]
MFPGGCCDDPATLPPSTYAGGEMMPLAVTGFTPTAALDRHRHPYAPHLQPHHQHRNPQSSYHQLRDSQMQHRDHRNMCAAMSSSPVTSLDNGYRSMSSSSLSSPMSSSSSLSPLSYRPVYSPNQPSYDCHGVPAHPSVADFPPQSHNQYYMTYDNNLPPLVGPNDAQMPVPTHLSSHTTQNNNNYYNNNNNNNNNYNNYNIKYNNINNNNNPYTDLYEYRDSVADKPAANNSSRQSRNLAEKHRREKLNNCITELSKLVPLISNSSKKIEKTSVLRLSAAYLRLNRFLAGIKEQPNELPACVKKVNMADLLLDDNDIYLMVTSGGKIVFVSHSVENILGYSQIDLMGQSLFNIANPKDHEELKKNLKYQDDEISNDTSIISNDDSSLNVKQNSNGNFKIQRRSFYLRLIKKVVSRDEQPELELVHVMGTLMVQNSGTKNNEIGENDIVLNAVVRLFNERRVTEVSMLEATREEYITRHQIDGRIIYVDHRISIVSGFMPQEVSGQLAFKYMHKDDVRWVMIALRQMYFKGQSFGSSCYRLLSKNGEFVYMRTHGFLQLNPNEDKIESFICVNTLVPPELGKLEIIEMKKRFTPLIVAASEPGIAAITNNQFMEKESTVTIEDVTEDLNTLDKVVEQMIQNIPEPAMDNFKVTAKNPGPLPDNQEYMRVALLSKSIPPVSVASNAPKIYKRSSLSPQPNIKPVTQDRPSVLRVAPPIARQPVLVYNHQTYDKTTEKDRAYLERRGGIFVLPKRQNDSQVIQDNLPKKAKMVLETQVESPTCSNYSNLVDSQSDNQLITKGGIDNFSNFQATPIQLISHNIDEHNIDPLIADVTDIDHFSKVLADNDLFLGPDSYDSYVSGVYDEVNPIDIIENPLIQSLQYNGSLESALLEKKQNTLKTKMDQQQGQLKEIQTELNSLSSNANTHFLASDFSHLKAEHEHQQQVLRELQGVHQNIGV